MPKVCVVLYALLTCCVCAPLLHQGDYGEAFWMGNLKHRDLRGNTVASQMFPEEEEEEEEEEQEGEEEEEQEGGDGDRQESAAGEDN